MGEKLVQFLAVVAVLHQDELKNRMICTRNCLLFCRNTFSMCRRGGEPGLLTWPALVPLRLAVSARREDILHAYTCSLVVV